MEESLSWGQIFSTNGKEPFKAGGISDFFKISTLVGVGVVVGISIKSIFTLANKT